MTAKQYKIVPVSHLTSESLTGRTYSSIEAAEPDLVTLQAKSKEELVIWHCHTQQNK